jgi:hypothetical protein
MMMSNYKQNSKVDTVFACAFSAFAGSAQPHVQGSAVSNSPSKLHT